MPLSSAEAKPSENNCLLTADMQQDGEGCQWTTLICVESSCKNAKMSPSPVAKWANVISKYKIKNTVCLKCMKVNQCCLVKFSVLKYQPYLEQSSPEPPPCMPTIPHEFLVDSAVLWGKEESSILKWMKYKDKETKRQNQNPLFPLIYTLLPCVVKRPPIQPIPCNDSLGINIEKQSVALSYFWKKA